MTLSWAATRSRISRVRVWSWVAAGGVTAIAIVWAADCDLLVKAVARTASAPVAFGAWVFRVLGAVSGLSVLCLVAVTVLYHVAAAVAARAAAGVPLPLGESIIAQFAVSAANRVAPAGLGGSGLLGRYLHRRGGLEVARAAAAVSGLAVLGALADGVAFVLLLMIGLVIGATSMTRETPGLAARIVDLLPAGAVWWVLLGAALVGAFGTVVWRGRRATSAARLADAVSRFRRHLTVMARSPGRLVVLALASAATTLVLAAGFAVTAMGVTAGASVHEFGALMIGYMLGAAAGSTLPTPGGLGSTDAALVGVLAAMSVPTASAVAAVLAFRAITFWAPAAVGLVGLRGLRRRGAL